MILLQITIKNLRDDFVRHSVVLWEQTVASFVKQEIWANAQEMRESL